MRVTVKTPGYLTSGNPTLNTFFDFPNGLHQPFVLPSVVIPQGVVKLARVVEVTASADIALYGMTTTDSTSCDGYLALPVDALGTEYYVVTHNQGGSRLAEFTIIANQAATVTITLPDAGSRLRFTYGANVYRSGIILTVTMAVNEVFQIQTDGDPSGTKIVATSAVGVLSGSVNTAVAPASLQNPVTGHIVETLPPTNSWGTSHFVVPVSDRARGDLLKMVTHDDDTEMTFYYSAAGKWAITSTTCL